jgi:hypothetical protein
MENDPRMDDFIRAMTPEQKLRAASRLRRGAWNLKAAWLRQHHPNWPEEKVQQEVRYAFISAHG